MNASIFLRSRLARLLILCLVAGCTGPEGTPGRILHRGQPGEPRTLDPQLADDDFSLSVVRDLYEGLTSENSRGEVVPGVADSWLIDDAKTTYTFHIRATAKWSSGEPVLAQDFVNGMRRAVNPATASGSAGSLTIIRGASTIIAGRAPAASLSVTAKGNDELKIELEHPAPYFLQLLSQPVAAPLYVHDGRPNTNFYNGAYVLERRIPGALIDLKKNANYWNTDNVPIQNVRFVNVESEETELKEYLAGQLEITYTVPLIELDRLKKQRPAELQLRPSIGVVYLALNLSDGPLHNNRNLREALSISLDRESIAHYLLGGASAAYSFVPPSIPNYDPAMYDWTSLSHQDRLKVANALYTSAGYSANRPLRIRLYYSNNDTIQRTMVAIAQIWKDTLGVESELIQEEFQAFLEGRKDRTKWDVLRLRWDADFDDPSSFLEIFASDSLQNDPAYREMYYDKLLSRARAEIDLAKRAAIYKEAEALLLSNYGVVPIYIPLSRRLVNKDVGGADPVSMARTSTKNLYWNGLAATSH